MRSVIRKIALIVFTIVVIITAWYVYRVVSEPAVYVTSYGAAGQVSGSLHVLKTGNSLGFIDCGNFYPEGEGDYEERLERANKMSAQLPFRAKTVDYVILTHAHLDHIGRLPLLVKKGFKGTIYVTPGTAKLMHPMIKSAVRYSPLKRKWVYSKYNFMKSQKHNKPLIAHWNNCKYRKKIKRKKTFKGTLEEMEDELDLSISPCRVCANMERDKIMGLVEVVSPGEIFHPSNDITATFIPNYHIPGSASVFLGVEHKGNGKTLLFSGDVGKRKDILHKSIFPLPKADYVWLESTYGDFRRDTTLRPYQLIDHFRNHVQSELNKGNLVWIPAFALDRTQKVLYALSLLNDNYVNIYVPSPLANIFNIIYKKEYKTKQNGWFRKIYQRNLFPHYYPYLPEEELSGKEILITTTGMLDNGVSESLLDELLPRNDVSIFLVGYQDPGTPGGQLKAGKNIVKWSGKTYMVNASVFSYNFFSAHADMNDALFLLKRQDKKRTHIYLIHGEPSALQARRQKLKEHGFKNVDISVNAKKIIIFK